MRMSWPAALVAVCLLGVAATGASGDERSSIVGYAAWAEEVLASPPGNIRHLADLEERLRALVAERRRQAKPDLPALETDPALSEVARVHAVDMLERGYTDHVGPDGRDVADRIAILYRRFVGHAGENLAEHEGLDVAALDTQAGPLAVKLIDGFMASESHRANLLSGDYTRHGLAAAGQGERIVVVHVFARPEAMLRQPLPLTVSPGDELALDFANDAGLRVPARYGFAEGDQAADEIVTLELSSNAVAVDPGRYRLKFLLPTERQDLFDVAPGPLLVVE